MPSVVKTNYQYELNHCMPIAGKVKLGDLIEAMVTSINANSAALTTLATKLNADAGVTDTNYVGSTAPAVIAPSAM